MLRPEKPGMRPWSGAAVCSAATVLAVVITEKPARDLPSRLLRVPEPFASPGSESEFVLDLGVRVRAATPPSRAPEETLPYHAAPRRHGVIAFSARGVTRDSRSCRTPSAAAGLVLAVAPRAGHVGDLRPRDTDRVGVGPPVLPPDPRRELCRAGGAAPDARVPADLADRLSPERLRGRGAAAGRGGDGRAVRRQPALPDRRISSERAVPRRALAAKRAPRGRHPAPGPCGGGGRGHSVDRSGSRRRTPLHDPVCVRAARHWLGRRDAGRRR